MRVVTVRRTHAQRSRPARRYRPPRRAESAAEGSARRRRQAERLQRHQQRFGVHVFVVERELEEIRRTVIAHGQVPSACHRVSQQDRHGCLRQSGSGRSHRVSCGTRLESNHRSASGSRDGVQRAARIVAAVAPAPELLEPADVPEFPARRIDRRDARETAAARRSDARTSASVYSRASRSASASAAAVRGAPAPMSHPMSSRNSAHGHPRHALPRRCQQRQLANGRALGAPAVSSVSNDSTSAGRCR